MTTWSDRSRLSEPRPRRDFNAQLQEWLRRANTRHHRTIGCRPADRVDADRAAMLPLPPVAASTGWRSGCGCRGTTIRLTATTSQWIPS